MMNHFFNLIGVPWSESAPPVVTPTFYQPTTDMDVNDINTPTDGPHTTVLNEGQKPSHIRIPPQFTISPLHVASSLPITPDMEQTTTESLLNQIDLSVLTGKKKKKKKIAVSIIPPDEEYLTPWLANLGMTEYESKEQRLHDEIVAFANYVSPTSEETQARQLVASATEVAVKKIFKDATVSLFGSSTTDLCLPDADIDLLITADIPRQLGARNALHQVSSSLRFAQISENSSVVSRAKAPIITLSTTPSLGSFSVDISINANTGVKAGTIVKEYLDKMPALRPLVLVLKRVLSQCSLDSAATAGLSTYALVCMVISFLQVNPKERPIEFIEHPMEHESLGTLLLDFLFYYTETFEYTTCRICVTSGQLLDKSPSTNADNAFSLSISCLVNPGEFLSSSALVRFNPVMLSVNIENDIGKPTTKLARIVSAFRDAFIRIQNYPVSIQHNNCLGTVVGFPQRTLNQRELISNLVASGSLEAQIKRCIVYMTMINPTFYPQKPKPPHSHKAGMNCEPETSVSAGSRDSYRPEYENGNAEQLWNGSRKRRQGGPEYQANYFGPRSWMDWETGSQSDGNGSGRSTADGSRMGSTDRGRPELRHCDHGVEVGVRPKSRSKGLDRSRERKRSRLD